MKEAIIFPVDREMVLLSEYMNYQEYHICEMVILEESNISDKDNNTTIPIVEARNVNYDTFDSIIVLDQEYMRHPFVVDSLKYGKEVLYVEDLEAEIQRYSKDLGFTVKHRPKIEYLDYAVLENEKRGE